MHIQEYNKWHFAIGQAFMQLKLAPAAALFFCASLFAQQFVDVVQEKMFLWDRGDNVIYEIGPDQLAKKTARLGGEIATYFTVRPKIRLDKVWVSNGEKIWHKPLDATVDGEWEPIKLPDGIANFNDFEIISDKDALICGTVWEHDEANNKPLRYDLHFIFNYQTGNIKKTIESLDVVDGDRVRFRSLNAIQQKNEFYETLKKQCSYLCRFDSKVLIVGESSGAVTILDTDNGRVRKVQVVPEKEIPIDPQEAVNNGRAIDWIAPLMDGELLICCKLWAPLLNKPGESVSAYCFRTLEPDSGKIQFHGAEYRGKTAKPFPTLFEENGELVSVYAVIKERAGGTLLHERLGIGKDTGKQAAADNGAVKQGSGDK
jgi:hypothetical protein